MKRGKSLLFVLVLGWVMTGCANPTPTLLNHTATPVPAAQSPLPTPTAAMPPTMVPTATTEPPPTATLPPSPLETPTRFQRPTPGPTTTPFPGTPLDFETISQGHSFFAPPEKPWHPTFYIFSSQAEWENFVDAYDFRSGSETERDALHNVSRDFDFYNNLLILGLMHVGATCPRTDHRVLGAWQDGDSVYIRVAWEETWDVLYMAEGIYYVLASISWSKAASGREFSFTFVSQWPPYYDGTVEDVAIVTRSLP